MSNMKKYVLGFAFDSHKEYPHIVLMKKNRPEWQKGFLNGIGGKIESFDLDAKNAMCREFKEETGLLTESEEWIHFATMRFDNDILGGIAEVYCFKYFEDDIFNAKTTEDEEIFVLTVDDARNRKTIEHVQILMDLALKDNINFVNLNMK